jgi:hypothetical protein
MNRLARATAGAATVAVTLVGLSGTAFAVSSTGPSAAAASDTPSSTHGKALASIQAKAAAAISRREASITVALNDINNSKAISAGDKTTLLGILNADAAGLTTLGTTIAADTTAAQAATDYATIFTTYRVYALALPQVHFAAASDAITGAVLPKLTDAQTKLEGLLAGADSAKNTPAVQAAMADLATQITAVTSATSGLSATVLAFTPAQYDANHALLSPSRAALATARNDVKTAVGDINTVKNAIQ